MSLSHTNMDIKQVPLDVSNMSKDAHFLDKLINLLQAKTHDKRLIKSYLSHLNDVSNQTYMKDVNVNAILVHSLCSIIQHNDTELVKLYCQYLTRLIKNNACLQKYTFIDCYKWTVDIIKINVLVINDLLLVLKSIIYYGPHDIINQEFQELISDKGLLKKLANPQDYNWSETNFIALQCVDVYLTKTSKDECNISFDNLLTIKNIAIKTLCILSQSTIDKGLFSKILYSCLRILHSIVNLIDTKKWPNMAGEVLGIIQAYLFYGITGYSQIKPEPLRPAAMNLPERQQSLPKRSAHFQNRRSRQKKNQVETLNKRKIKPSSDKSTIDKNVKINVPCSSDSEASDTENLSSSVADWKIQLKVVQLLSSLKDKISSRELFGYWPQIIVCGPESANARVFTRFLLKVPDPNKKIRQIALSVLAEIIEGARNFLSHAEEVEYSSFLPFFGLVSVMIKELHNVLSLLLSNMKHFLVLTQVLKCTDALVQSTPYSRMNPGLATKLIRNCRIYLLHSDPTVRVAVLLVFDALASTDPMTAEIKAILEKMSVVDVNSDIELNPQVVISDIEADADEEEYIEFEIEDTISESEENVPKDSEKKKMCSLIRVVLHNIAKESIHDHPVRIQSLRLLGTIASNVGNLLSDHIELIAATLVTAMMSPEQQISLHACRVIETISGCLSSPTFSHVNPFLFWNIIFEPVINLMQHMQTALREAACNCLSSMGPNILSRLSRDKIILIITLLFGATRDEESAVRAAGVRALGVLVSAPVMEEDAGFLMDLADVASLATEDENLGVRVKASWALASLCDVLLKRNSNPEVEPIPLEIVMPKLFETSINAANDNNKVKSNAMRALGSIMSVCTGVHVLKDTTEGLNALIFCATKEYDMKICWNACHALGLILSRNPDQILPPSWKDEVFPVLSNLICESANFKVRINAAWAISVCTSFGKYIPSLWKNIILALENAQHVPNYVEYTHHDALVQQLCLAFCHIALYTELSDLNIIWPDVSQHINDLYTFMKRFQLQVLPEKTGDLLNAKLKFYKFLQKSTTAKEKEIVNTLVDLFEKTSALDIQA